MAGNNYRRPFDVDIVFCIDATGSMEPCLKMVKENALKLYDDIVSEMKKQGKEINQLRARLIAFRDYKEYERDKVPPLLETKFFVLPEEKEGFRNSLMAIRPEGGGDEPEDGLEALAFAIKSNWTPKNQSTRRRQIILLWSDASTHELGYARGTKNYPPSMARDFNELTRWWGTTQGEGDMEYEAKRLLLYAPDKPWWSTIASNWPNVIHIPVVTGEGLKEQDYRQIVYLLVKTIVR